MDKHELVACLKEIALELGRTPSRAEFESRVKGGKYKLERLFGGYTPLVTAAGLEPKSSGRPAEFKITSAVFEKSIESHLENYTPRAVVERGPFPTLAIISDIHWPFESQRVIDRFYGYIEEKKPKHVILNGDAWDMYSHSKYPRSHNVFTPREEQRLSREKNETFWKMVQSLSPQSQCVQMLGNHDVRPMKRVIESYPEAEDWIEQKLQELFTFEGVKTIFDVREEFYIREDIVVFHGYRSQLGAHRDYTLMSCFNGHTHRGGVVFRRIRGGETLFECNSGVAGDPEAKGLTYTPQKITDWTPGFAVMDEWGPRFIPV